jgi:uncharacterized protein YciI
VNQWLYRIVPTRDEMVSDPTGDEESTVGRHFQYLVSLKKRGVLILAGRTQDAGTFGIVIFEAPDEAAARQIVNDDPAVAAGVFAATLHPYFVAVARDGVV